MRLEDHDAMPSRNEKNAPSLRLSKVHLIAENRLYNFKKLMLIAKYRVLTSEL